MMIKIYRNWNIPQTSEINKYVNSEKNRTTKILIHRSRIIPQTVKLRPMSIACHRAYVAL